MGWIAALFVGVLGWLLVHDIRRRKTALAMVQVHRDRQPGTYWAIMSFWLVCLLLSALLAWAAYLYQTACGREDPCTITIQFEPQ